MRLPVAGTTTFALAARFWRAVAAVATSILLVPALPAVGQAQTTAVAAEHHPWARFEPGAWKRVRGMTETLDARGMVADATITETKTTLIEVAKDGVTLQIDFIVERGGKRFTAAPRTIKQGFHGEVICPDMEVGPAEPGSVVVEGRKIPCVVQQITCPGSSSKTVSKIYYAKQRAPYVLRRESVTADLQGDDPPTRTTVNVELLDMPNRVLAEVHSTAYAKMTYEHAKGTAVTLSVTSADVPGGVVRQSAKEVNPEGRVTSRSTLELLNYGLVPEEERTGVLGRRRMINRLRRPGVTYTPR